MKVLVLNAHDDDAVIGIGGTLIQLRERGWKIGYLQITDSSHGIFGKSREETKKIRSLESKKERDFIGIEYFNQFDIEDCTLKGLSKKDKNNIVDEIIRCIRQYKPDIVFLPERNENHSDHRIINNLGHDAIKKSKLNPLEIEFFVWMSVLKNHKSKRILLIPIDKWFNKKIKAIKLHKSQENLIFSKDRYSILAETTNNFFPFLCPKKDRNFNKAEIVIYKSGEYKNLFNSLEELHDITDVFNRKTTFISIFWKEFLVNIKSFKKFLDAT